MPQAKGVLPRSDDRELLYKNPMTCGYFVAVKLDPAIDRARVTAWVDRASGLVDALVAREDPEPGAEKGRKVAAVAVGFAPSFFHTAGQPRFDPALEPPAAFAGTSLPNEVPPLSSAPAVDADVMFYIASVFEARVNAFVSALAASKTDVVSLTLDRGYQRLDETEPFGYRDGLRNVRTADRPKVAFVHRDGTEPYEPAWADGGTYMTFMRIAQQPDVFGALPDDASRDQVIGRAKDGQRLDLLGRGISPREEPQDHPVGLPPSSHVRKAGPRGEHGDTQIFRRGLPFMETTPAGALRVGLNFCSFQASLEQFDVVFNDWMTSRNFPPLEGGVDAGVDALMDPQRAFTAIEKCGFYFVPPYNPEGLAAAVLPPPHEARKAKTARITVRKRVLDPSDASKRFERRGFRFQILDAQNQPLPGSEFSTDSTGRGICPVELEIGQSYFLQETFVPVQNVVPQTLPLSPQKRNELVRIDNQVTQPNTPYGRRPRPPTAAGACGAARPASCARALRIRGPASCSGPSPRGRGIASAPRPSGDRARRGGRRGRRLGRGRRGLAVFAF
jgi:deferrochelatase/peroxidase EfeB